MIVLVLRQIRVPELTLVTAIEYDTTRRTFPYWLGKIVELDMAP